MEHVYDFKSQPLVAPKEAALTSDQIKELVQYAEKYYVTICRSSRPSATCITP